MTFSLYVCTLFIIQEPIIPLIFIVKKHNRAESRTFHALRSTPHIFPKIQKKKTLWIWFFFFNDLNDFLEVFQTGGTQESAVETDSWWNHLNMIIGDGWSSWWKPTAWVSRWNTQISYLRLVVIVSTVLFYCSSCCLMDQLWVLFQRAHFFLYRIFFFFLLATNAMKRSKPKLHQSKCLRLRPLRFCQLKIEI